MKNLSNKIVIKLEKNKNTISFMESCSGGFLANEITNIEGSSKVLKVSLITYSNEFKTFFGVNNKILEKYTEYSKEISQEMAKKITKIANSNYGIGITGKLSKNEKINIVYYSIYDKNNKKSYNFEINAKGYIRKQKKKYLKNQIFKNLLKII